RGLALGVLMTSVKLGPALAFPLATSVMASSGWRAMFVLTSLIPLVWLPAFLWSVRGQTFRSARQPNEATAEPTAALAGALVRSPAMWGMLVGTFSYLYFFFFCLTWLPTYLEKRYGLSLNAIGWYTTFAFIGPAVMTVVGGRVSDWLI